MHQHLSLKYKNIEVQFFREVLLSQNISASKKNWIQCLILSAAPLSISSYLTDSEKHLNSSAFHHERHYYRARIWSVKCNLPAHVTVNFDCLLTVDVGLQEVQRSP